MKKDFGVETNMGIPFRLFLKYLFKFKPKDILYSKDDLYNIFCIVKDFNDNMMTVDPVYDVNGKLESYVFLHREEIRYIPLYIWEIIKPEFKEYTIMETIGILRKGRDKLSKNDPFRKTLKVIINTIYLYFYDEVEYDFVKIDRHNFNEVFTIFKN